MAPTITNKHGLPEALVAAVRNDPYAGGGDISVTKLIAQPLHARLGVVPLRFGEPVLIGEEVTLPAQDVRDVVGDASGGLCAVLSRSPHDGLTSRAGEIGRRLVDPGQVLTTLVKRVCAGAEGHPCLEVTVNGLLQRCGGFQFAGLGLWRASLWGRHGRRRGSAHPSGARTGGGI